MPMNVMATLRTAVRELEAEKARIDYQLVAIRRALGSLDGAKGGAVRAAGRVRRRRRMSAAARRAVSRRMKAYWAKRRGMGSKEKGTSRRK